MADIAFEAPSWLSDQDAATIHQRMMDMLPENIDNTEAGWPWDLTNPFALEKAEALEFHLVETLKIMHPMWAYGTWLDAHGPAAGVERKGANPSYGKLFINGIVGTVIPEGFLFAVPASGSTAAIEFMADNDYIIDADGTVEIGVEALNPGTSGNVAANTVTIMTVPIKGITSITNPAEITGGAAEEDDEHFRTRIMDGYTSGESSFVGCDADYIRWAKSVKGVGDAFVVPEWDNNVPNSVKVVVLDANGRAANEQILSNVYEFIISPSNRLQRLAPIGAIVTVEAPDEKVLNYTVSLVLESSGIADDVITEFKSLLISYYPVAKSDKMLRFNKIGALLMSITGVLDYNDLLINGAAENISIFEDEYPVTGNVENI